MDVQKAKFEEGYGYEDVIVLSAVSISEAAEW